jgi:hypothetical protein
MKNRIYVDFNCLDARGNIVINPVEEMAADNLCEGMLVILYDEELEVEAHLRTRDQYGMWAAMPDWTTKRSIK